MPQIKVESRLVQADALRHLGQEILYMLGLRAEDAFRVADSLVQSNLRGIDSHGIARLLHYAQRIKAGSINPTPNMTFKQMSASLGLLDADHALGQLAMWQASTKAIAQAKISGASWVTVRNSSHCGALAYYGLRIASEGMLAIVMTHSDSMVAPHGASTPFCGTNPLCIAAPGIDGQDLCLDMSTSCTPWNSIVNAAIEGVDIPNDWALDASGKPTTDPNQVAAVHPMGEYKGSGLGLMIDVFCSFLSGGPYGPDISKMYGEYSQRRLLGGLVGAIDICKFVNPQAFRNRIKELMHRWNQLQPATDQQRILWPGQPELQHYKERAANGIPIGLQTLEALCKLAQKLDIPRELWSHFDA